MSRLWLRSEVFDGVLPLRATGVPLSPARNHGPGGANNSSPSPLFVLLKALREVNQDTVRYTTWITEGWRVLLWSEPSAKLFWEMLCMYLCHSPRLGTMEAVPYGLSKDLSMSRSRERGDDKVQSIELPVSQLGLFLFLHLHPDSTTHRLTSQRAHNADSVWPSEEAAAALGGSPRRGGGAHSPGRAGHGRATSPTSAPLSLSPRSLGTGSSSPVAAPASAPAHAYPTSPLSPTRSRSMRLHTRSSDDAHRLSFVKRHLHELLRVASSHPDALYATPAFLASANANSSAAASPSSRNSKYASSISAQQQAISEPGAGAGALSAGEEASSGGRAGRGRGGGSGSSARTKGQQRGAHGEEPDLSRKPRERVPISELVDFLSSSLTVNEITYPISPSPATILLADATSGSGLGGDEMTLGGDLNSHSSGNSNSSPNGAGVLVPPLPSAPLLVNCACRTTVVYNADASGPMRDLQVNYCQESYVYVLTAVRFATVLGCKDCTVVIGAAACMVRVEECERMQLVTCCRRLTVTNSLECIFPVFVATSPVLSGDNRACQFAPYNSCYPRNMAHLRRAGLLGEGHQVPPNLWATPVEASMVGMPSMSADQRTPTSSGSRGKSRSPGGKGGGALLPHELSPAIMPPEQFYTLAVPVPPDSPGDPPVENPFGLPPEYAAVLQEREAAVESLHQAIVDARLTPRQNRELEECIRGRFTEWLVATGNLRQVLDLVTAAEKQRSGSTEQTPPSKPQQHR